MSLPRLPSLGAVIATAVATARRFPLVLIAAVASAFAAILLLDELGPALLHDRLLAAATLGLPLYTAVTLFGMGRSPAVRAGAAVAATAALAGVYLAWPGWTEPMRAFHYIQLSVAFHLAVAFAPFTGRDLPHAFWQFNRALFVRFLIAGASSATLFGGLAIALAAVDKLFGVNVPDQGYGRLFFVMAFVVNTWFFLGGVPADIDALEERRDYPVGLRVFAQYTLVPLVSVYLVILTVYLAKVVVTWDWPSGSIGWLVSGVAAAGILALLLVHPIAEQEDQKWVRVFARDFWLATLPAVVMLWLALWQRIAQYGVTEPRYFLLVLSLWLFAMALYYTLTRSGRIRIIPVSLCALALTAFAGPWSAYAVAGRSQVGRLTAMLERQGIVREGRLARPATPVRSDDSWEIAGVVRYLLETGRGDRLAAWIGDSLVPQGTQPSDAAIRRVVLALGVEYRGGGGRGGPEAFSFDAAYRDPVAVAGYDYMLRVRPPSDTVTVEGELRAVLDTSRMAIRVARGAVMLVEVPLDSVVDVALRAPAATRRMLPANLLEASAEAGGVRALVLLERLGGQNGPRGPRLSRASGAVLVRISRPR